VYVPKISRIGAIFHNEEAILLKIFGLTLESSLILNKKLLIRLLLLLSHFAPSRANNFHSCFLSDGPSIRCPHNSDLLV
jgi:hypothetical protein